MPTEDNFASRVSTAAERPDPFGVALEAQLADGEAARILVYGPAFSTAASKVPATVLGVTDTRWLAAIVEPGGSVSIDQCGFADTLLLELTAVLLHGQLKIDFVEKGQPCSAAVQYNTVREREYREAVGMILENIEVPTISANTHEDIVASLDEWPIKFRSVALMYVPRGQRLVAAAYWPAIYGGFNKELSPSTALLLTERETVLIAEEMSPWWHRRRGRVKYGEIITYFPLSRLARTHIGTRDRYGVLGLEVRAEHGGERLDVIWPLDLEDVVTQLASRATAITGDNHEDFNNL